LSEIQTDLESDRLALTSGNIVDCSTHEFAATISWRLGGSSTSNQRRQGCNLPLKAEDLQNMIVVTEMDSE